MNTLKGGQPHGPDRRVRLLLALLVILAGSLVFLSTPYSEKTLGIKLSSLFSSANLSSTEFDSAVDQPIDDTIGGGGSGGGVFNCIKAPCVDSNWAIVNPEPNTVWQVGDSVKISWNGPPRTNIKVSTFSLRLSIAGQDCNNTRVCFADYTIVENGNENGTYEWKIPNDFLPHFLDKSLNLTLSIDGAVATQTTVQISKKGNTGDQFPDGTFFRLLSDPRKIYKLENGTKRQLPYPAEEVITCLGGNPANIVNGTSVQERIPIGAPLFCNPTNAIAVRDGNLISGLPDSDVTSVYLVQKGKRRPFPNGQTFECLGYSYNNVHIANYKESQLPIGAVMSCDNNNVSKLSLLGNGTLPNGSVNISYNTQIVATGGIKPYTFSIANVTPNAKVEIDNNGQINAKFSTPGTYQIKVRVIDSTGSLPTSSIDILPQSDEKVYTLVITGLTGSGSGGDPTVGQNCTDGPIQSLVALYRYHSSRDSDHYYSVDSNAPSGYVSEGITAYVYPTPVAGTVAVYQSYNSQRKDHYYTTDQAGAQSYGYKLDGKIGYVYPTQVTGSSPLYRMYNDSTKHYLTTASTVERDAISSIGFAEQGTIGYTCGTSRPGSEIIPIYRLWSSKLTDHFYTTDVHERDAAMKRGYVSEGIMGNIFSVPGSDRVGVQRLWSAKYGDHFYTTSESEAKASGFSREGVIGYVQITPSNTVSQLYRLNNTKVGDHFYTTSTSERDAVIKKGYKFEGTIGYLP